MDERARAQARYNISETCVDYVPLGELLALTGTDGVSLWEECCSRRLICGDIEGFPAFREGTCVLSRTLWQEHVIPNHGTPGQTAACYAC